MNKIEKINDHSNIIPQKQIFQPIVTNISTNLSPEWVGASNSQLVLPKTPVKQSLNSLLISASPISSASSPNNSSLQNISQPSPISASKISNNSVIKNNTINNTSINNNINLISQSDSCFYNLNSINKLNGLKNMNLNYANNSQGNNVIESNIIDHQTATQRQTPDIINMQRTYSSPSHSHNHNQHLSSGLNDISKMSFSENCSSSSPSKNNQLSSSSQPNTQFSTSSQHQHPIFHLNPYQQQLYYAYLMQQQQQQSNSNNSGTNSMDQNSHLGISGGMNTTNINNSINTNNPILKSNLNTNTSNSNNATSAVSNLSKNILESALSNMISNG